MLLILIAVAVLLAAILVLAVLLRLTFACFGRRPRRYWRRVLWVELAAVPVGAVVVVPLLLGYVGSRWIDTRPDERGYAGPRIAVDGTWELQSRAALADERAAPPPPSVLAAARAHAVRFTARDGVTLQGYLVPPRAAPARCSVVLTHGLFRNAMEVEPVAAMFREHGAEVLLLELRNHGGSGRAPATFGLREAADVEAACAFLRARPDHASRGVVLFAVSMSTAAAALAAPHVPDLAGLVLDAPMDDLAATADRMLSHTRNQGRRVIGLIEPFRSLVLASLQLWSGFDLADVRPDLALASLPAHVPILLIGGADDDRMPADAVRALYAELKAPEGTKQLWIRDGSKHGQVWLDDPADYRARLAAFLEVVEAARARHR